MRGRALSACSFLLLGLASCGGGGASSLLLITLDTTRVDALGAYGCKPSVTPNLDALAADGVVFEQAYTVAPLTLPAHASMLTGLVPPRHGVRDNGIAPLPQAAETLAERAQGAGFQTAAFLGSAVLDAGFGLEQGFERYEAPARRFYGEGGPALGYAERPPTRSRRSSRTGARDPGQPFSAGAPVDAHAPYSPPRS
jgi:arylsulfatase A-like enzyme